MSAHMPDQSASAGARIRSWRHHRKLSQLELAGLANISARHLSFIETGRGNASPSILQLLANSLQIPLQEQNRLLMAAGYAPRYEEAPITDEKMTHVRNVVRMILDSHNPFSAFAINQRWDILAHNETHGRLLSLLLCPEDLECIGDGNIMRLVFHPKGLRNHIVNWPQFSGLLIQSIMAQRLVYPGDPGLEALAADAEGWMDIDPRARVEDASRALDFAAPMVLRLQGREISLVTTRLKFAAPLAASVEGLTIESFYPADARSEAELRAMAQE